MNCECLINYGNLNGAIEQANICMSKKKTAFFVVVEFDKSNDMVGIGVRLFAENDFTGGTNIHSGLICTAICSCLQSNNGFRCA